jgi:hypothetical protein
VASGPAGADCPSGADGPACATVASGDRADAATWSNGDAVTAGPELRPAAGRVAASWCAPVWCAVRTMPAGLEALAWLPVAAAAGPADMPAATAAMAAAAATVTSRLVVLVARYWSPIDDLADWNRGDLACGEVKACLSQGVGDAQRAPRFGRPEASAPVCGQG